MNRLPPAVLCLLILNIAAFLAGFGPGWRAGLVDNGALWFPGHPNFGAWQVVTYMFLHADVGHIFFNMFAVVSFGTVLEREWSWLRFLLFYFLCGIGAGLVQLGVNGHEFSEVHARLIAAGLTPENIREIMLTGRGHIPPDPGIESMLREAYLTFNGRTVGASGAVYGLLIAFGCLHPNARLALMFVPVPIPAKFFIPGILALDLLSGVTGFSLFGPGVAHFAHLGGAAIGFVLMLIWRRRTASPPRWREAG